MVIELSIIQIIDREEILFDRHNKNAALLFEVPCGDKYPTCKFIRGAHTSKDQINIVELAIKNNRKVSQALKEELDILDLDNLMNLEIKDANEIMKQKDVFSLKSSFLPFSDIWRYKLLYLKGGYWVDLDMIAIRRFDFKEPFVFSSERTIQEGAFKSQSKLVPNIGILKAPAGSEFFKEAYEKSIQHNKIHTNEDKIKYMRIFRNLVKKYKMLRVAR